MARQPVRAIVDRSPARPTVGSIVELLLPLLVLGLLIALCIQLLAPFVGLILWTLVLAVCFYPLHNALKRRGISNRLSASIIGTLLVALILIPTAIATISAASSVPRIVADLQTGERHLQPPPESIKSVPLVGQKAYAAWSEASADMPAFAKKFGPQLASFTKWMVGQAGSTFVAILLIVLAVIFAAITLAYAESVRNFCRALLARITGDRGRAEHYMAIIGATIRSVANGVIGVAFVQALLCGIGFFVLGVPGAGILSLAAMVIGIFQVPVVIVTLPAIIWAFSSQTMTVAIIFTVWEVIAGLSDAALKPLLIGHGLEVPMPVILLGVIGGAMAYGLVGLFFGAVLLAVGYVLLREWLDRPMPSADAELKIAPTAAE